MKRNKLKSILSIIRPVGAAEQMLPQIGPADLVKVTPHVNIRNSKSGHMEPTSKA